MVQHSSIAEMDSGLIAQIAEASGGAQGRNRNSLCLLPSGQLGLIYVPTDVPTEH